VNNIRSVKASLNLNQTINEENNVIESHQLRPELGRTVNRNHSNNSISNQLLSPMPVLGSLESASPASAIRIREQSKLNELQKYFFVYKERLLPR
jgi:hypothetical protein